MTENENPDDAAAESSGLVGAALSEPFTWHVQLGCPSEGLYSIV